MNEWFERLIDLSALPANQTDIVLRLEQQLKGSGFAYFSYVRFRGETVDYRTNLPPQWCESYIRTEYLSLDPIVTETKRRRAITAWALQRNNLDLTKAVRKMYADAYDLGIRSGVSVPISIGFGHWAMFSLISKANASPDPTATDPVLASAAVAQLHAALSINTGNATDYKLTPREARCLRWIAEGKSMEIAAQLEGISYGGARFFLKSAKATLGAVSLPQATALAREMKLI
jgi:LuxR family transcriptional activator of conjugal transfer of Ti plasmids